MSKWLSIEELLPRINEMPDQSRLLNVYGASHFASTAFYAKDFEPDNRWGKAISLTNHAEEYLEGCRASGIVIQRATAVFAMFRLFYHNELFIDHEKTNLELVLCLLSELHSSRQAIWPYAFGTALYNKFNDTYIDNKTDHLDPDAANSLLENTPQGVYQIGNLLSGPLGFITSSEVRILPPTLRLGLWHCSDPGCLSKHYVKLNEYDGSFKRARDVIARRIIDNFGPPSEWDFPLLYSYRKDKWPDGRPYNDLPAVISDCIIGEERHQLCLRVLKSKYNPEITSILQKTRDIRGTPEQLVRELSPEEQHQLLLLIKDSDLVDFIDDLIGKKQIHIPASELRVARTYRYGRSSDRTSSMSSLGIRSTSRHIAPIELGSSVWNIYERLGLLDDLAWRVRSHGGATLRHQLFEFLRVHGPHAFAREVILVSRTVTNELASQVAFRIYDGEKEEVTIRRLLWKFGFDLPRHEDDYHLLRDRISQFEQCIVSLPHDPNEHDRARIRSVGVNLFVSVEQLLEDIVSYNVWLMASDHFTGTHFSFNREQAVRCVPDVLGTEIRSGSERFSWSRDGTNTLGCLLVYLEAFRKWLSNRQFADKTAIARSEDDYPHYSSETFLVFPFKHKELWADSAPEILSIYLEAIDKLCTQLNQAGLAAIRNGLDHKRHERSFPSSDSLLACASRLKIIFDAADAKRLIPKLFWGVKSELDNNQNMFDTFQDYRGLPVSLSDPQTISGVLERHFGVPYIIAPFDFLNYPNSLLIFTMSPASPYKDYWDNYPRRRFIPKRSRNDSTSYTDELDEQDILQDQR